MTADLSAGRAGTWVVVHLPFLPEVLPDLRLLFFAMKQVLPLLSFGGRYAHFHLSGSGYLQQFILMLRMFC